MTAKPATVDEYIKGFAPDVQQILLQIREAVRQAVPDAEEAVKYGMPTYVKNGNLLSFGAYKKHIGVYPVAKGDEAFQADVEPFRKERSTLQFPLNQPIPLDLIARLAKFRAVELEAKG